MQNLFILLESDAHSNRDMQDQKQATLMPRNGAEILIKE